MASPNLEQRMDTLFQRSNSPTSSLESSESLSPKDKYNFLPEEFKLSIEEGTPARRKFYLHPLGYNDPGPAHPYRDQYIREFSSAIREKPNWTSKVTDRTLFAKWLMEAEVIDNEDYGEYVLAWYPDDVHFSWEEMGVYREFVEGMRAKGSKIEPDIDGVWRADGMISEELRAELIKAVSTLENVPEEQKDYHPGSNNQVLDLVHPSLWPIIYGRSVSLVDGKIIERPKEAIYSGDYQASYEEDGYPEEEGEEEDEDEPENSQSTSKPFSLRPGWSDKFCWLPSEFEVSADGKETKIKSYINNLSSPEQKELFYPILEKIFTQFVPLYEHVLADLDRWMFDHIRARQDINYGENSRFLSRELYLQKFEEVLDDLINDRESTVKYTKFAKDICWNHKYCREKGINCGKIESNGELYPVDRRSEIPRRNMWTPPDLSKCQLGGKTLKVIVKLANIILTPENPKYKGGSWHVEAMLNERIVSTGIYYYAQENITDSQLAFQKTFSYIEEDQIWAQAHRVQNDGTTVQEVGRTCTKEDRAIAFPNMLQHCVKPFELVDATKPGYRKILVFFLCDPSEDHKVPTTRTVAAQQPEERSKVLEQLRQGPTGNLPEEVFQLIADNMPPVVTLEEAKAYREELMKERSVFNKSDPKVIGRHYSFCEH